jgi:hypothetical protein
MHITTIVESVFDTSLAHWMIREIPQGSILYLLPTNDLKPKASLRAGGTCPEEPSARPIHATGRMCRGHGS